MLITINKQNILILSIFGRRVDVQTLKHTDTHYDAMITWSMVPIVYYYVPQHINCM